MIGANDLGLLRVKQKVNLIETKSDQEQDSSLKANL